MPTKVNLVLDITIFSAFLLAMNPALTGLPIHEWLSVAFIATLVTHLLFHWNWIVSVTRTFIRKFFHSSRLNYVVDSLLFASMIAVMLSGILISRTILSTLGIRLEVARSWRSIHSLTADLSLLFLALHFALHWNWVVTSIRRYVFEPLLGIVRKSPAVSPVQISTQVVPVEEKK